MDWDEDLERLCALDRYPELRDRTSRLFPGITVRYVLESLIPRIEPGWPDATRTAFRIASVAAALGIVAYDQFTISTQLAHQALETALRQRMEASYPDGIPLTRKDGSVIRCPDVTAFTLSKQELGGTLVEYPWFRGNYGELLHWCKENRFLTDETAKRAGYGGKARNALTHTSGENQIAPGTALGEMDFFFGVTRELWSGEPMI